MYKTAEREAVVMWYMYEGGMMGMGREEVRKHITIYFVVAYYNILRFAVLYSYAKCISKLLY